MDPQAMRAAMDMMSKLPPDQLRQMMSSMGNVTPEMMAQAQAAAKNMRPEDWDAARRQVETMSPEQLQATAGQASSHLASQQKYVLTASQQLKNEGNQLHSSGQYAQAVEKYTRAKQNVEAHTSAEAAELRRACTLNLASCYLAQKQWPECIEQCNQVLAGEPDSLKALYRRGQAYMGLQGWEQAVADLSASLKLSASDPAQQRLIRDKLQEAKDQLSAARAARRARGEPEVAVTPPAPVEAMSSPAQAPVDTPPAAPVPLPQQPQQAPGGMPMPTPEVMRAAAEHMRRNPDWASQVQSQLAGMSDEQLAALGRAHGAELTRDRLAGDWASRMSPEQLERMAAMHQQLQGGQLADRLRANPSDPEALAATSRMMADNPEMVSSMADMLTNMPPDQLAAMAKQMGMPGDALNPELMKTAAETFKNMSPEEVKAMGEAAARLTPPTAGSNGSRAAAAAPAATAAGIGAVSSSVTSAAAPPVLSPEMAKAAADMMASMPPEQLAALSSSLGGGGGLPGGPGGTRPALTPDMMQAAAKMMAEMSPDDMQRMAELMGGGGGGGLAGGVGGAGLPPDLLAGMMDPKSTESALKMVRGMPPEALSSMLLSSGMIKSKEQADAMAKQLQGMSDRQVKFMATAASVAQRGAQAVQQTKEFVRSRMLLVIGVVVLLLALLLRWLGVM